MYIIQLKLQYLCLCAFLTGIRRTKCAKKIFRQLEAGFHHGIKGVGKIIWDFH